jgi:hypothetical protein
MLAPARLEARGEGRVDEGAGGLIELLALPTADPVHPRPGLAMRRQLEAVAHVAARSARPVLLGGQLSASDAVASWPAW